MFALVGFYIFCVHKIRNANAIVTLTIDFLIV